MTRLFLARHGTHDLVGKVLAGRMLGVSLSAEGRAQADGLARFFAARDDISSIFSSPLERCRETAAPIAVRLGLELSPVDALNELDCGEWTGRSFGSLAEDARWRAWNAGRASVAIPGGETSQEVVARVMGLVASIATEERSAVIVVTHADVIKCAILSLLGASLDHCPRLEIDPASITTVDLWPGGGKLVRSNQTVPA